jgi:hypothetical protein
VVSEYWRKPNKYKQLPERKGWAPPVATLSLDASRRLVISQQLGPVSDPRFTCPEPPPDVAMNTLSQTLVSLSSKTGDSAQLGSAYAAIAQVLASRTSTVEFWRTTSSTFCILLMNGRTTEAYAYLEVAKVGIASTKDTMAALPDPAAWPGDATGLAELANKKQQEAEDAAKAAAEKQKQADAAAAKAAEAKKKEAELEKAKQECAKVADDKKADDANCKKVKEAEAGTAKTG